MHPPQRKSQRRSRRIGPGRQPGFERFKPRNEVGTDQIGLGLGEQIEGQHMIARLGQNRVRQTGSLLFLAMNQMKLGDRLHQLELAGMVLQGGGGEGLHPRHVRGGDRPADETRDRIRRAQTLIIKLLHQAGGELHLLAPRRLHRPDLDHQPGGGFIQSVTLR